MSFSVISIVKNKKLLFSLFSQLVTLVVSLVMTVGVTQFISVENFGYWQLFIFYVSYVGLAHLGICDGLYLSYGGKNFNEVDKSEVKGVFFVFAAIQLVISFSVFVFAIFFINESVRQYVLFWVAILLIVSNFQIFFGYILLSTNRIIEYSKSVFIEKLSLLFFIVLSIVFKIISLEILIYSYLLSKLLSNFYLIRFYKDFISASLKIEKETILFLIKSGGTLMISNIVSTLILGVGRYFIDKKWDISVFGKISLSISLVYFVLVLLSQISFLLFPYLRNNSEEDQKRIFLKLNYVVSLLLIFSIVLYLPLTYFLNIILPTYTESIDYLVLLLPLCLFDGKLQIVYTSYIKNLYLQKELLIINIVSLLISLIFSLIGAYVLKDINIILIGIVLSIMLRSILTEKLLKKHYDVSEIKNLIFDLIFSGIIIGYYFIQFNFYVLLLSLLILLSLKIYFKSILKNENKR